MTTNASEPAPSAVIEAEERTRAALEARAGELRAGVDSIAGMARGMTEESAVELLAATATMLDGIRERLVVGLRVTPEVN